MKKIFFVFFGLAFFASPGISRAANSVYYSVGQNTSNHCGPAGDGNNCGDVSITSGVATFSAAQAGNNLGIGDVLTAGGNTYYLATKNSTTSWNVVTNLGTTPSNLGLTAVTSIAHAFSSLSAALPSGAGGAKTLLGSSNLTAIDVQLNISCYYDTGADTTRVTINGWTTDSTRYVRVYAPYNTLTEVNQSQRHEGKWSATKYNLSVNLGSTGDINVILGSDPYIKIEGLQISHQGTGGYQGGIFSQSGTVEGLKIDSCIIKHVGTLGDYQAAYGIGALYDVNIKIFNTLIYDYKNSNDGSNASGINTENMSSAYIYNVTIVDCTAGINRNNSNVIIKNTLVYGHNPSNQAFEGTYNSASDYNATDDDAATGGAHDRISQTFSFADYANDDFHLTSTDTGAKNFGTDQVSEIGFSTDLDSQSRSGLNWDIGADEATFNGPFTMEAWVKPDATPASQTIIAKAEEMRLATDANGKPLCQIKSGFAWQTAATSSDALSANQWAHISCAYDQTNLKIYVNGVEKGSQALTVGVDNMTSNWKIGTDDSSDGTYGEWSGLVDDFRFYNYARASDELVEDFNAGHPAGGSPIASPITDYNFDEGVSSSAYNKGNGGSIFNATLQPGSGGANTSATQMWSLDGMSGKAVELDGTDDKVDLPDVSY